MYLHRAWKVNESLSRVFRSQSCVAVATRSIAFLVTSTIAFEREVIVVDLEIIDILNMPIKGTTDRTGPGPKFDIISRVISR